MEALRALLFSAGIFVCLAVISIAVAAIMALMYVIVHRTEKKDTGAAEAPTVDSGSQGKVE